MHKEETLVMPLAEKLFGDEDWRRIDAAFGASRDPLLGVDEDEEFRQLFNRIVSLVPAPLGAGPAEWRTALACFDGRRQRRSNWVKVAC